jgi:ActR/RegA family two-component response regulator
MTAKLSYFGDRVMKANTKVLYVEDDKEWQEIVKDGLSTFRYQIEFASTGKEAISKLKRSTFHVVLLDKRLDENDPEDDQGLAIAAIIAGMAEGTEIIIYTAYGNLDDARESFLKIKAWDFIGKDKPIVEILNAVNRAAENAIIKLKHPTKIPEKVLTAKGEALDQFVLRFFESAHPFNSENLESFARHLLQEYHPLLSDHNDAQIIKVGEYSILQFRFWSKILALPIALWFGEFDEMRTVLQDIDSNETLRSPFSINKKIDQFFDADYFPEVGGAVLELKGISFEEFDPQLRFSS